MIFIHISLIKVSAIALYPFCLIQHKKYKGHLQLLNHERIHFRQQIELLIIPFYFFYLLHYLILLARLGNHDNAYRNIVFEKEAYANDQNLEYLKTRKIWSFMNYFKS